MSETAESTALVEAPQEQVTAALVEVTKTNTTLTELATLGRTLAEKYRDVVWDVTTTKGMDEAKAARLDLRENVRYKMQRLQEAGSKMLGTMQRQFNARANELISEVEAAETPIDALIKTEEDRKEQARLQREQQEAARKQGHVDALAAISQHVIDAVGEDSAALQVRIDALEKIITDESWQEFQGQAQQAKDKAVVQLRGMLMAAKADEEEAAELAAERERQAAFKRQQDEREAALREREEKVAAQERQQEEEREGVERAKRERAAAVQARIDQFWSDAAQARDLTAERIALVRTMVEGLSVTVEEYDDRVAEAQAAKDKALSDLTLSHAAAVEREAAEFEQAVQKRLEPLRLIADDYNEHCSSAEIGEAIATLENFEAAQELFGEKVELAYTTRDESLGLLRPKLKAAQEREERARQEAADAEAAHALSDAITAAAPELYGFILGACINGWDRAEAVALLQVINPNENFEG